MSDPNNYRRLIPADSVAEMLGMSKTTFLRKAAELASRNFPEPIFKGAKRAKTLWDSRAIDLWLDAQMDPALRGEPSASTTVALRAYSNADKLAERAAAISI
ncbi:MAG: hypothetical protein DI551_00625 [Micavibrio aeruginosavorus]|uniref:AlpA family phage regulatory protein n=1 Tax=Micavibrio aeruginosavorus TaxID=349221 RepID=A0A2W5N8K8_9BACT|nr:MAG: hypothetical protein DI551_00625 [Micavibrio aeruginosavorus]